jgi:hypothetical protein
VKITRTRVLLGVALAITGYVVLTPPDSATPAADVAKDATASPTRVQRHSDHSEHLSANALSRLAHRAADATSAGELFAVHSWYTPPPPPPPPPPAPAISAEQAAALRTPTAPPLPFQFIGSYAPDGEATVFFLTRADRVYDVHVGEVIDESYSVDGFNGSQLLLTYKPLNIQQQLAVRGTQ